MVPTETRGGIGERSCLKYALANVSGVRTDLTPGTRLPPSTIGMWCDAFIRIGDHAQGQTRETNMKETTPQEPGKGHPGGDWALSANGKTYRDRSNEAIVLKIRVINSSASVTGIAGERGAGKSSLALRVLDLCKRETVFSQLIHSPTGYEPREFLVSVCQSVCDEVILTIEREFAGSDLLEDGKRHRRRLVRNRCAVFGALLVPVAYFGGAAMGAELAAESTDAFRYAQLSKWPVNSQNAPKPEREAAGLAEGPSQRNRYGAGIAITDRSPACRTITHGRRRQHRPGRRGKQTARRVPSMRFLRPTVGRSGSRACGPRAGRCSARRSG